MKTVILSNLLQQEMELTKCPFALFDKEEMLIQYVPYPMDIDWSASLRMNLSNQNDVSCLVTKDMLLFGKIHDIESGMDIIAGPVFFGTLSANQIRSILINLQLPIQADTLVQAEAFFQSLRSYSLNDFINLLCVLGGLLNQKNYSSEEILGTFENKDIFQELVQTEQVQFDNDANTVEADNTYEEKMLFYVEHGMVNELKNIGSFQGVVPQLGYDSVRHYKNAMIILNTLCLRAAVKGGADAKTCYQMGQVFMHKIESCSTLNQLIAMNESTPIALTFANMVNEIPFPSVQNQKIKDALIYIRENYQKRLTVSEIADHIAMSSEYLSVLFHQETGTTIPSYITDLKIRQSQALLLYTDLSILQISEILSFSSQSYFQTLFKKKTGMTPAEFRADKNNKITSSLTALKNH
jgi:AraC-like DNA-binding protein